MDVKSGRDDHAKFVFVFSLGAIACLAVLRRLVRERCPEVRLTAGVVFIYKSHGTSSLGLRGSFGWPREPPRLYIFPLLLLLLPEKKDVGLEQR